MCFVALSLYGCNAPAPSVTSDQVQQFVRDYATANNSADATRVMSMVLHEANASSISGGKINLGWDAIRTSMEAGLVEQRKGKIELGTVDVTLLSPEAAVAVGTLNVRGMHHVGNMIVDNLPVSFTVVVKRTPEGLRLVHEHYSVRATLASK